MTFQLRPNIVFWHWTSYFAIQNPILTFETRPNIVFGRQYPIWHSNWRRILYFDVQYWKWGRISYFDILNPILTFELRPNISFWHLKSYFVNRNEAEYRILTLKILFWHSNWARISYFVIHNPTFELMSNMAFLHSQSYFDIRI